ELLRRFASCSRLLVFLALVSSSLWFWLQGSVMLGRPLDNFEAAIVVARTRFGEALLLRVHLLVLAVALLHGKGAARATGLSLLAAAALLQGLLGHGAATDCWTTLALGLHVLAAGLWLGALPPLLAVCR